MVEKVYSKGISVEVELGVLVGVEDDFFVDEEYVFYINLDEVEVFVKVMNCDSLVIVVGISHGVYKFLGG